MLRDSPPESDQPLRRETVLQDYLLHEDFFTVHESFFAEAVTMNRVRPGWTDHLPSE